MKNLTLLFCFLFFVNLNAQNLEIYHNDGNGDVNVTNGCIKRNVYSYNAWWISFHDIRIENISLTDTITIAVRRIVLKEECAENITNYCQLGGAAAVVYNFCPLFNDTLYYGTDDILPQTRETMQSGMSIYNIDTSTYQNYLTLRYVFFDVNNPSDSAYLDVHFEMDQQSPTTCAVTTSIDSKIDENLSLQIYPNPTSSSVKIKTRNNEQIDQLNLLNITGQTIKSFNPLLRKLDVSDINTGIYFVQVTTINKTITQKLTIQ